MAALLIAYILVEDARSSRLAMSQHPHGHIAQLFLDEPLPLGLLALELGQGRDRRALSRVMAAEARHAVDRDDEVPG